MNKAIIENLVLQAELNFAIYKLSGKKEEYNTKKQEIIDELLDLTNEQFMKDRTFEAQNIK